MNGKTLFFAGVDWERVSHQVCVVDPKGCVIAEKSFKHTGSGIFEMARWMMKVSGSQAPDIAVAIEVNHGPVVESLLEQDFKVYSINPRQLDRFRDRFCMSGAKDDRRDAMVLASALGTDRRHFRRLESRDPDIIVLRELNRTREELVGERTRLVNRFRGLLWRITPSLASLWATRQSHGTQNYGSLCLVPIRQEEKGSQRWQIFSSATGCGVLTQREHLRHCVARRWGSSGQPQRVALGI